jgi:hypothetical protein
MRMAPNVEAHGNIHTILGDTYPAFQIEPVAEIMDPRDNLVPAAAEVNVLVV